MNKEETMMIFNHVSAYWGSHFSKMTPAQLQENLTAWIEDFQGYTYVQVYAGVKAYRRTDTSGFPPTTGQVMAQLIKMQPKCDTPTETEALSMVVKAVRNGIYGSEEEFAKLPAAVQKAVGSPTMLTEWATTPAESAEVWHSNFLRTYRTVRDRVEKERALPESMRAYTKSIDSMRNAAVIAQKPELDVLPDRADTLSPEGENALKRMREALESVTA